MLSPGAGVTDTAARLRRLVAEACRPRSPGTSTRCRSSRPGVGARRAGDGGRSIHLRAVAVDVVAGEVGVGVRSPREDRLRVGRRARDTDRGRRRRGVGRSGETVTAEARLPEASLRHDGVGVGGAVDEPGVGEAGRHESRASRRASPATASHSPRSTGRRVAGEVASPGAVQVSVATGRRCWRSSAETGRRGRDVGGVAGSATAGYQVGGAEPVRDRDGRRVGGRELRARRGDGRAGTGVAVLGEARVDPGVPVEVLPRRRLDSRSEGRSRG